MALKKLFSKFEYFLLKRSRNFVIDSESDESSGDDYFRSKAAFEEDYELTERINTLLTGSMGARYRSDDSNNTIKKNIMFEREY